MKQTSDKPQTPSNECSFVIGQRLVSGMKSDECCGYVHKIGLWYKCQAGIFGIEI